MYVCMYVCTVISGLYSAPINRPHLLIFKRKKKLFINKPRLSISRRCPRDCGQASRHSRLCGQISRHGNSTAPIILTFTVNTSKPPRMGSERRSTQLEEQHPVFILRCTQSLFLLRCQCHFPPEANPPLSLRCPPHHGGFTPDAEAQRYATPWSATPWSAVKRHEAPRYATRCAVKRSFQRRVYFLRSPRAYRARKHTEKWAVCVITERNRSMTGVGKKRPV